MNNFNWKKNKKIFAFILCLSFLAEQPGFADERFLISEIPQAQSAMRPPLAQHDDGKILPNVLPFSLNAGTVKNSFQGNPGSYVIHIQDAHINKEIQQNMARLVDFFVKHYGVKTVYLEGASGELSHRLLSEYPNPKARSLVASMFLKQGLIGGAEFLALTKRPDLVLEGVEDQDLYDINRQAYLDSQRSQEQNEKILKTLHLKVEALSYHVLPQPMVDWMRRRYAFHRDETGLQHYVPYLAEQCGNACGALPGMHTFLRLEKLNAQFNAGKAKEEWPLLLEKIQSKLADTQKQELLRYQELYKKNQISRKRYAEFVIALLPAQEPLRDFPNLKAYFEMIRMAPKIGDSLFEEIQKAEKSLEEKWIQTEEQAELAHYFKILEIYEKLFDFSLSREDAEFFYKNREEFYGKVLRARLNAFFAGRHFDFAASPGDFEMLDRSAETAERFYQAAMDRDEVLAKKTLEDMKRRGEKISIVITGGFHTPQIESYLRRRNVSYSVILPALKNKFDADEDRRLYAQRMQADSMPLWNVLAELHPVLSGRDPRFQLQPPRRLPLMSQMRQVPVLAQAAGGFLPQVAAYPFLDFTLQGMLALSLQANRIAPGEISTYPSQMNSHLEGGERNLAAAFYPFLHDAQISRRVISPEQGNLLTAFDSGTQMGVEAEWFPLEGSPREGNARMKQEVYFKTPDGVVTRARLLADPDQYRLSRAAFLRLHAAKQTQAMKPKLPARIISALPQLKTPRREDWHFKTSTAFSAPAPAEASESFVPLFSVPSETDLMMDEKVRSEIRCGNQGVLMKRESGEKDLVPKKAVKLMERMGRVTKTRGEQAAGRVAFTHQGAVYKRVVNPKRADLAGVLRKRSARAARRKIFENPAQHTYMVMEHYRYGTSSAPHEHETHPFKQGHIYITHNGDFDYWNIFGKDQDNFDIGVWLQRVLQTPSNALGDSPKVAAMMNLLMTQGMWDASARLAYQLEIAKSMEDAFGGEKLPKLPEGEYSREQLLKMLRKQMKALPNTAPSKKDIKAWGDIFETVFSKYKSRLFLANAPQQTIVPEVMRLFETELLGALDGAAISGSWTADVRARFIKTAIKVYLENDLNTATKIFMSRAKGSFGLVTASTREPEHVVISARGQPMSVGFDRTRKIVGWASESAALKVPIEDHNRFVSRIDLDQIHGEIMDVSLDGIRLYSEKLEREVTAEELAHSGRIIDLVDNPYITPLREDDSKDRVGDDLREIPKVLTAVREDWENEESFNRQTAEDFLEMAADQARERWYSHDDQQDLIVLGTEISGSLAQQFVADYKRQHPAARVMFVSPNKFLKDAKKKKMPYLGSKTMVLAVSQSGQTFPTLNATILLEKQVPNRVFVMTGELDTLMGAAAGQHYYKGAPFSRRIFTNGSGRRPAEPSTVAAAAAHQTLTELLLFLGMHLRAKSGLENPFDMPFQQAHFQKMIKMRNSLIDNGITSIVGYNARGDSVGSAENKQIRKQGRKWAAHVLEPFWVVVWTTAYLILAIFFGLPLSALLSSGYTVATGALNWGFAQLGTELFIGNLPAAATAFLTKAAPYLDTVFGVFFGFITAVVMRFFTKRIIFTRLGKRTVVIGDVPYVNYLLEEYVSKIFSMSFGWASVDVHGSDPGDEMVHEFGHRIVRGTLVFLGRPDGAVNSHGASEADHLMTGKQGKGVRNYNVGAEVVSVGHNPVINPNAMDSAITLWAHNRPKGEIEEVEEFYESRFSSFERLLSGFVFFHAMGKKVSTTWPLNYDMSRTQSGTRVATTRSPVSGADITQMIGANGSEKKFPRVTDAPAVFPFRVLPSSQSPAVEKKETAAVVPPQPPVSGKKVVVVPPQPPVSGKKAAVVLPQAQPRAVTEDETAESGPNSQTPRTASGEKAAITGPKIQTVHVVGEDEILELISPPSSSGALKDEKKKPEAKADNSQPPSLDETQRKLLAAAESEMQQALDKKKGSLKSIIELPPANFDPDSLLTSVSAWLHGQVEKVRAKDPVVAGALAQSAAAMEADFKQFLETAGKPRAELREVQLFQALDGTKAIHQAEILANSGFADYEQKAAAAGLRLPEILENFVSYLPQNYLGIQGRNEGEVILNYKAEEHTESFLKRFFGKLRNDSRVRQVNFFKDARIDAAQWKALKEKVSELSAGLSVKVYFSEETGSLEDLIALRAQALKLPLQEAVQLLDPAEASTADREHIGDFQLGAVEWGKSTLVVLGSEKPAAGVKTFTISKLLQTVFQNRSLVQKAA